MKKIAIVSSFSESCGNAYFTHVLIDSMTAKGYQVECVGLNLLLTQSANNKVRAKAERHINELCNKLKEYDGVNIQFEAGLYGTMPGDIVKRTIKLLRANPNTSITLHSPRLIQDNATEREAIKMALKLKLRSAMRMYFGSLRANISMKVNEKVIRFVARNNINTIVHTNRAKEQIELLFDYKNVEVHPLKFVDSDIQTNDSILKEIKSNYGFDENNKIIGVFGFVNEYKGHSLAIKALTQLPANYKLMFFGRQHPQTIKNNELVNKYIETLQLQVKKLRLENRVFFMGEYGNEDFINLASSVDFVWLPYVENGQDGSGIASICFNVSKRVLCSSSFAFDELFKIVKKYNNYARFDIGNYMELATKTRYFMPQSLPSNTTPDRDYTLSSQADLYINKSVK
ncbi:hypothetical protein NL54_15495 [Pantoea stewartii]|uniref:glycosyltransferase n=1 Tax=Pantoea stewartii TaxID=66269 RepID=UPI0005425EE8|nr:glycosyltransferase [Pantoea stewartii]KHE00481.1 hypothetical protein NL54_15495 [Pantoea stewartii]KHN65527.1 hypothetical protein OI73_00845 [Pantoea stewartii]